MVRARHPFKIRCKTGAKNDGTLVARELSVILDCGAYGDDSPGVLGYSLLMGRGPYRIPHCRCSGKLVYTNRMRFGAFPRLRQSPGHLCHREPDRRDRRPARHGPPRSAREEHDPARRPLVRRRRGRVERAGRMYRQGARGGGLAAGQGACSAARQAARPRRRGLRPYQRPAGDRRHRPVARGRLGRAQHRRGRYRPRLRYRADPDVRLGIEGSGRPGGDRQPGYRRLALQLGHDGQPGHLHDRPLGGRGGGAGCRRNQAPRRGDFRMRRRGSGNCATAAGSASWACRTRN